MDEGEKVGFFNSLPERVKHWVVEAGAQTGGAEDDTFEVGEGG